MFSNGKMFLRMPRIKNVNIGDAMKISLSLCRAAVVILTAATCVEMQAMYRNNRGSFRRGRGPNPPRQGQAPKLGRGVPAVRMNYGNGVEAVVTPFGYRYGPQGYVDKQIEVANKQLENMHMRNQVVTERRNAYLQNQAHQQQRADHNRTGARPQHQNVRTSTSGSRSSSSSAKPKNVRRSDARSSQTKSQTSSSPSTGQNARRDNARASSAQSSASQPKLSPEERVEKLKAVVKDFSSDRLQDLLQRYKSEFKVSDFSGWTGWLRLEDRWRYNSEAKKSQFVNFVLYVGRILGNNLEQGEIDKITKFLAILWFSRRSFKRWIETHNPSGSTAEFLIMNLNSISIPDPDLPKKERRRLERIRMGKMEDLMVYALR